MDSEKAQIITEQFLANYFKIELEDAKKIQEKLERIVYKSGEAIVTIGEPADGLYFIDDGQATVFNANGEAVNEMKSGTCFGEYAILADEPRMTTVKSHGQVVAFRMKSEDFLDIVGKNPKITGRMLKKVYGQVSEKHTKLASLTRQNRGVTWAASNNKDHSISNILITYGITVLVFLVVFIIQPYVDGNPVWWQLLPVVFLMVFTLRTRRIVEGMLLTVLLLAGMLNGGRFISGFADMMIEGIGNKDTASTIVIMAMVEAVAALLSSAGVVSAFRRLAEKRIRTKPGSMMGMLFIMIVVCLDECLNVTTAGYCMNDIVDKHQVPRESRALLGSYSMAICSLIPFSLWGAYISGWLSMYLIDGGNVFLKTIPFNLVGILALVSAVLLCFGVLPKTKQIKEAYARVQNGGKLWPDGSEKYFETEAADEVVGKPINLFLPMLVWIVASMVCGLISNPGSFTLAPISGLVITLIFMFMLYVGQRLMTPREFFEVFAKGIGNSLMPILLLVFAERIAASLETLEFDSFLEAAIPTLVGGHMELIPTIIFVFCTLICLGLGCCWGMYGLGIPISIYIALRLNLNVQLCVGAALAAGIIGESLCPYMDETSPVVKAIGCGPEAFRKIRFQYWIPIGLLCMIGYLILGIIYI